MEELKEMKEPEIQNYADFHLFAVALKDYIDYLHTVIEKLENYL